MAITVRIHHSDTVTSIEQKMKAAVVSTISGPAQVILPTDAPSAFFADTRIVSLFALLARSREVRVELSASQSQIDESRWFETSLLGLACATFAHSIYNPASHIILRQPNVETIRNEIYRRLGLLELESGRGRSITACAFDPAGEGAITDRMPLFFTIDDTLNRFWERFTDLRRSYLEIGLGENFTTSEAIADPENALGTFVFELLKNTYEHGRWRKDASVLGANKDRIIPGFRYLRIQKHIGTAAERLRFVRRGDGMPMLTEYLEAITPHDAQYKFYELTISDHGLGIVDRFIETRPEYGKINSRADYSSMVRRIIDEQLSSKRNAPGAGAGFQRVLESVNRLRGYVAIRSNGVWLVGNASTGGLSTKTIHAEPCGSDDIFTGVQINLLMPMS